MRAALAGSIVDVSVFSRFLLLRRLTFCRNIGSDVTSSPATLELELASHEVSRRRTDSGNLLTQPMKKEDFCSNRLSVVLFFFRFPQSWYIFFNFGTLQDASSTIYFKNTSSYTFFDGPPLLAAKSFFSEGSQTVHINRSCSIRLLFCTSQRSSIDGALNL